MAGAGAGVVVGAGVGVGVGADVGSGDGVDVGVGTAVGSGVWAGAAVGAGVEGVTISFVGSRAAGETESTVKVTDSSGSGTADGS